MRYYCEFNSETINHVTPSVLMLDHKLQCEADRNQTTKTILDLGCGNGRNSLYLAKKYNAMNIIQGSFFMDNFHGFRSFFI
jgi:methylase of polypeptide subunit release factors